MRLAVLPRRYATAPASPANCRTEHRAATYRAIAARLWQVLAGAPQRQAPKIVVE